MSEIETRALAHTVGRFHPGEAGGPLLVLVPAMGTPAAYYDPLGKALGDRGINVAAFDLRGIGDSPVRASRDTDFGYHALASEDLPAIIAAARERFPGGPLFLLGHSLGGQLSALYLARGRHEVRGLVLVATSSVYYRGWSGARQIGVLGFTQIAALLANVLGHFPGAKIGFGGREARSVVGDWARLARSGRLAPKGADMDYEAALARVELPILAVSIAGDRLAPRRAVDNLVAKMPKARLDRRHLAPEDLGDPRIDHFRWARSPAGIVGLIETWMAQAMV